MSDNDRKQCPICGTGHIEDTNLKGTTARYKDEPELRISEDVFVPQCDACGEVFLKQEYTQEYDHVLAKSYRAKRLVDQKREIQQALDTLNTTQAHLETLLGVSQGYVSKLLSGEKVSSAITVRFLHVLGSVPGAASSLEGFSGTETGEAA